MLHISKKIVTDEEGTPVAVQVDYEDWEQIEEHLRSSSQWEQLEEQLRSSSSEASESSIESTLEMTRDIWTAGDGLAYQRTVRSEWGRSGEADTTS